jgi:hypothetical protein
MIHYSTYYKSSHFVFTIRCLVTDPNDILFCSRRYRLATVSHLTHGFKYPHILDWNSQLKFKVQSYVTTDGQSTSLSWCQAPSGKQDRIFVTVRQLRVCWCGAPSLRRGRVCRLQLLLASLAQSFSGPSPAGLMTTLYCLSPYITSSLTSE